MFGKKNLKNVLRKKNWNKHVWTGFPHKIKFHGPIMLWGSITPIPQQESGGEGGGVHFQTKVHDLHDLNHTFHYFHDFWNFFFQIPRFPESVGTLFETESNSGALPHCMAHIIKCGTHIHIKMAIEWLNCMVWIVWKLRWLAFYNINLV